MKKFGFLILGFLTGISLTVLSQSVKSELSPELSNSTQNKIYRATLGREITPEEFEQNIYKNSGQLLDELLESDEYKVRIRKFVEESFKYHLDRDLDSTGLDFWSSRFALETFYGIIDSEEYKIKNQSECVNVTRVLDGDTIELGDGRKVRYIGVNTPEISHNENEQGECFGHEAKQVNENLVLNQCVYLEKDISETDPFDRYLFYVYNQDGTMINEYLTRFGYAEAKDYPPDTKYSEKFHQAQSLAEAEEIGKWNVCKAEYQCSENIYNCSDFNTQSEAQNLFEYCMSVSGKDIHGLDKNNDGVVCTSL